jgi:predicted lipid-binding transport protein (Tim44 family)
MNDLNFFNDSFLESKFITNVNNIFIQLHLGITTNNLDKIKHFVNDSVFNTFKARLDNLNNNNQVQMFDEINVKQTSILEIKELDDKFIAKVNITSRYMDYILDKNTGQKICGDNTRRIEKENYLTFEKKKNSSLQGEARKCHSCGANIDVNANGKCEYCGTIYDLENHDWILTDLETI